MKVQLKCYSVRCALSSVLQKAVYLQAENKIRLNKTDY
jgi:hypothetical protein